MRVAIVVGWSDFGVDCSMWELSHGRFAAQGGRWGVRGFCARGWGVGGVLGVKGDESGWITQPMLESLVW